MSVSLGTSPQVPAFLQDARERPEDDTPRLVLADYLEDHGDHDQGGVHPPPVPPRGRAGASLGGRSPAGDGRALRELQDRRGGCWLGPLWHWSASPLCGTGACSRCDCLGGATSERWRISCRGSTPPSSSCTGAEGCGASRTSWPRSGINHVHLDFRTQLARAPSWGCSEGFPSRRACAAWASTGRWPCWVGRRERGRSPLSEAAVSEGFLARCWASCRSAGTSPTWAPRAPSASPEPG